MTREEAKRRLLNIERCIPIYKLEEARDIEAIDMAINALKREPKMLSEIEHLRRYISRLEARIVVQDSVLDKIDKLSETLDREQG